MYLRHIAVTKDEYLEYEATEVDPKLKETMRKMGLKPPEK